MESAGSEYRKITPNAPEQILVTQVTSNLFIQVFPVCYFIAPPKTLLHVSRKSFHFIYRAKYPCSSCILSGDVHCSVMNSQVYGSRSPGPGSTRVIGKRKEKISLQLWRASEVLLLYMNSDKSSKFTAFKDDF